jgi:titin
LADCLELRELLSGPTFVVTSPLDAGENTLRTAIFLADANRGSTIDFRLQSIPATIKLLKPLPAVTAPVIIDGTSQPGFKGSPLITIDGSGIAGAASAGINFVSGSSGSMIDGLAITGFAIAGITVDGATDVTIGGSIAGEGNVISGNPGRGIALIGSGTSGVIVEGNLIGTDATGAVSLANGVGLSIVGATANTIGGNVIAARNVISGNTRDGVLISGSQAGGVASLNVIQGNYIGTNAAGNAALANGADGVNFSFLATNNTVGGEVASDLNVVSGNALNGIEITGAASAGNVVAGNVIGTNAAGTAALANGASGVSINGGGEGNTIGGIAAGAGNVISGNETNGVEIANAGSDGNLIAGNVIGTNAAGTTALANGVDGININGPAMDNTIGGTVAGARNVISGNTDSGIAIAGAGVLGDVIAGNYIGTDASGRSPLANQVGIIVSGGTAATIGGQSASAANVVSGNITAGIEVTGNTASAIQILGNLIGTDPTGSVAVLRAGQAGPVQSLQNVGVAVIGSDGNTIGGESPNTRNLLSGNYVGVMLATIPGNSNPNRVLGNLIGTDISGTKPVGNIVGIYINGAADNQIGGTGPGSGNVISGNSSVGVEIFGSASAGNRIEGNTIGLAADGRGVFRDSSALFTQQDGIFILDASSNTIGGKADGAGNVISGNQGAGVLIQQLSGRSSGNTIDGNFIGLGPGGAAGPGNAGYGIALVNAPNNPIGRGRLAANRFGRNGIADVRNYSGPVPTNPNQTAASRRRIRKVAHPGGPVRLRHSGGATRIMKTRKCESTE